MKNSRLKLLLKILLSLSSLTTLLLAWLYWQRSQMLFNENGRFFDKETAIVYHEQSVELIGILTIIGLIVVVVLGILYCNAGYQNQPKK